MGGGALPIAYNKKNKKVYLLFGKENEYLNKDSPGWSDFGGGEKAGESAMDTALREGCEELNGFFGCEGEIKKLIKDNLVTSLNHERYTTFLFEIEYDENLPYYFNNNYKFLNSHVNKLVRHATNGLFEKSVIKWMTFDDLRNERGSFRSYYRNVVDVILDSEHDIVRKIKGHARGLKTATVATTRIKTTPTRVKTPTPTRVKTPTPTRVKTTATTTVKKTPTNRYGNYKYDTNTKDPRLNDSVPVKKRKGSKKATKTTKKNKKWFDSLW